MHKLREIARPHERTRRQAAERADQSARREAFGLAPKLTRRQEIVRFLRRFLLAS